MPQLVLPELRPVIKALNARLRVFHVAAIDIRMNEVDSRWHRGVPEKGIDDFTVFEKMLDMGSARLTIYVLGQSSHMAEWEIIVL